MPIQRYGVWLATPTEFTSESKEDDPRSPHGHVIFNDGSGRRLSSAVNLKSGDSKDSRLVYWIQPNFSHHITERLAALPMGFRPIGPSDQGPNGIALDYIRGNMLSFRDGTLLPHDVEGEKNDIRDYLTPKFQEAIKRKAKMFLFGEKYDSDDGIHDIHMNQGSGGNFRKYNGVWQDGGLMFYFPDTNHWEATFLAFASESTHTDDATGHPIGSETFGTLLSTGGGTRPDEPPVKPPPGDNKPPPDDRPLPAGVKIRAALLNPLGEDQKPLPGAQPETVYLANGLSTDVDVSGWSLVNNQGQVQRLPDGSKLRAGQSNAAFAVPNCPLSNKGGTLSLLNAQGLKVDGVNWTKQQAKQSGVLVYFQ